MLGVELTYAQQPEARQVSHPGVPTWAVTEPAIAAGPHTVVTVFFDRPNANRHKTHYGAYNLHTNKWARGAIDPNGASSIMDVSIVHNANSGGFLAVGKTGGQILTCRFAPGPKLGEVTPGVWVPILPSPGPMLDKPWIVAGDPNLATGQEYYIVYMKGTNSPYLHSLNGGESWTGGNIQVDGQTGSGVFCAQPAVYGNRPLYVAYVTSYTNPEIWFLVGEDVPTTENVEFSRLLAKPEDPNNPVAVPLSVPLNRIRFDDWGNPPPPQCLPGGFSALMVPQLAVDPTNPDRLYIVYHDIASNVPSDPGYRDVNIYLRELIRDGNYWQLDPAIDEPATKVNNDNTPFESDQFMPSVTVDDAGRIQIIFYDDRNYNLECDQVDNEPEPKYDAYYAAGTRNEQGVLEFTNHELYAVPPEPALDWTTQHVDPREYIGITWYRYGDVVKVWTAYTGTWAADPQPNDGVMWSSLIPWTQ